MSKTLNKAKRLEIYNKYSGHCSYCGKTIEIKDMQVDHVIPQRGWNAVDNSVINDMNNLNPSCRRCNHYKRGNSLEAFRRMIKTIHERVRQIYICKVAEDYGVIKIEPWDGKFYFERVEREYEKYQESDLKDKNGNSIKIGDRTRLILDDGEVREFDVCFKTVKRTVKSHPDFDDEFATVNITGVVFCWEGYDLFPCINENGVSDVSKMEIIERGK